MSNVRLDRKTAEATLEKMIVDYRDSLPISYRIPFFGSDPLRDAINASPDLKERLLDAVSNGYLTRFTNVDAPEGASAGYAIKTRVMHLPESALKDPKDLIFVLGHETQHACSQKGVNYVDGTLVPGIAGIAMKPPPHDYTAPIKDYVDRTLAEEAQAHIGGFNAAVSALAKKGQPVTVENLYRFEPGRMRDFIDVGGTFPNNTYQLKQGLTQSQDGSLAYNQGNIDAMKQYYADKFPGSFGDNGLLNYRHEKVMEGWHMAHEYERIGMAARQTHTPQQYTIDFAQLGTNPALLNTPQNGQITTQNPIDTGTIPGLHVVKNHTLKLTTLLDDFPANTVIDRQQALANLQPPPVVTPPITNVTPPQNTVTASNNPSGDVSTIATNTHNAESTHSNLYMQALEGVRGAKLDGVKDREQMINVAGALALEAHKAGLTSIDHVVKGDKGNVFAVQGDSPHASTALRANVSVDTAKLQPIEQSNSELYASLSRQTQQNSSTAQLQTGNPSQQPHGMTH